MEATDFLLDDDGDLMLDDSTGFVIGLSDEQHIQLLFILEPGELKESPLAGIGATRQVNGVMDGKFRSRCMQALQADGYDETSLKIDFSPENLDVYAVRK